MILNNKELLQLMHYATAFAAGKDEVRTYLQNVLVRNVGGTCHIVAADGHRMTKIEIPDYIAPIAFELVTSDSIKNATKIKDYTLSILADGSSSGTYPDYQRLLPTDNPPVDCYDMPAFNAVYLEEAMAALGRLFKQITGDKYNSVILERLDLKGANVFRSMLREITVKIVIMPIRK